MFQTTNQIGNYRPSRILITGFALGGKAKVLSFGDACLGDIWRPKAPAAWRSITSYYIMLGPQAEHSRITDLWVYLFHVWNNYPDKVGASRIRDLTKCGAKVLQTIGNPFLPPVQWLAPKSFSKTNTFLCGGTHGCGDSIVCLSCRPIMLQFRVIMN